MGKKIVVASDTEYKREIDLGPFSHLISKYRDNDVECVLYRLSYAGKYIYIKGKSLAGSLIILTDTLKSFNPDADRFKDHLYTHFYNHLLDNPGSRLRVKEIAVAGEDFDGSIYELLKQEQMYLDSARYDPNCLNNQIEAYIPKYNESTGMYGWVPKNAVVNFRKWLSSRERKGLLKQYKK
jgi:hypothetical protein